MKSSLRSAKEPKDNSGPIKTLVATTYEKTVNDPDNEVLVNICAPLHEDCIAFQKTWEELGE